MGKLSNITNSQDVQSINSRIFVGNLNTSAMSKAAVHTTFSRYGRVRALSIHRGYAFVQYSRDEEARAAAIAEDQRMYAGQPVDVNLAAEPKPDRPRRKRPCGAGAEWDYYYDVASVPTTSQTPIKKPSMEMSVFMKSYVPKLNRRRHLGQKNGTGDGGGRGGRGPIGSIEPETSSTDILICGVCKTTFASIDRLAAHKLLPCRLRFSCHCRQHLNCEDSQQQQCNIPEDGVPSTGFVCASCQRRFASCWQLCQHCQQDHQMAIYVDSSQDNAQQVNHDHGTNGFDDYTTEHMNLVDDDESS